MQRIPHVLVFVAAILCDRLSSWADTQVRRYGRESGANTIRTCSNREYFQR